MLANDEPALTNEEIVKDDIVNDEFVAAGVELLFISEAAELEPTRGVEEFNPATMLDCDAFAEDKLLEATCGIELAEDDVFPEEPLAPPQANKVLVKNKIMNLHIAILVIEAW